MIQQTYYTPERLLGEAVNIDLVGVCGNGPAMLDALVSMAAILIALGHPGLHVRALEPDTVSRTNLGRQRFTAADLGHNKAMVLTHRLNLFYGQAWQGQTDWRTSPT